MSRASNGGSPAPGGEAAELVLPLDGSLDGAAAARRFVIEQLTSRGLAEVADDAALVVNELVVNALLHAGAPAEVVVGIRPEKVRLEVRDPSPALPVRARPSLESMTGRGLQLVEGLASRWGVTPRDTGKAVWVELDPVHRPAPTPPPLDEDALLAMWAADDLDDAGGAAPGGLYTVRLGSVPTDLLLAAKGHVDNLVREFTLASSGAVAGTTEAVPPPIARLIDSVTNTFTEARESIKRQALEAANAGQRQVELELRLPASAAEAGERYLEALDEADSYCRAARLLTLESPPQHRLFRRWYVGELIAQLRRAAAGDAPVRPETFDERLLREIDVITTAERRSDQAARLHQLALALAVADTPEAVAEAVLHEGVTALGASGGGVMLTSGSDTLTVTGTLGYDDEVVARLRAETPDAELPAATVLRTGVPVWLESRAARDESFPELRGVEPDTVSSCAVPLEVGERRLGALRFSFPEAHLFDADERAFILAMAAQTAQALDRAQLQHQRMEAARRLQRSLLPPTIPEIPGVAVSVTHQPGTEGLEVGGDFYDVWPCSPGRWAVAIGDVSGSGPEAAALSALARHTLRALTMTTSDVEAILGMLHTALSQATTDAVGERFCTVVFGFLDVASDRCALQLASGGHPGPVVLRADGSVEHPTLTGSLLGILPDITVSRVRLDLAPGDAVVLVTDGVIEARDNGRFFGADGVARVAREALERGVDVAAHVKDAVTAFGAGRLHDDLAVLALCRLGDVRG